VIDDGAVDCVGLRARGHGERDAGLVRQRREI